MARIIYTNFGVSVGTRDKVKQISESTNETMFDTTNAILRDIAEGKYDYIINQLDYGKQGMLHVDPETLEQAQNHVIAKVGARKLARIFRMVIEEQLKEKQND